ncbi:hypothetical protein VNO77_30341 [Canavalia gladiata]|uniref:Uncharacterized protein n=1 Tax=Canavalia gladiata TaxID=3824 RepID=A0AAN9Q1B8_CANGL
MLVRQDSLNQHRDGAVDAFVLVFVFCDGVNNKSSLVERLRVRSNCKPIYAIDVSDAAADILPRKRRKPRKI